MRTLIPTAFFVPLLTALPLAAQDAADRAECALELAPRKFDMEGIRKAGLMYMPASLMLQAERPACVRKEPTYEGKPRYATLTLGNDAHSTRAIAVDEPEHGDAKVYLDLDGDGDLSDDGDGAWPTKAEREGASASYSGTFVFHVGWQAADGKASSGDYGVNFYYSPDRDRMNYHTAAARVGSVSIGDKTWTVTLMENDCDARFDKRFDHRSVDVVGAVGKPVWLSLDGDRFDARGTFPFRGMNYLADVSDDGAHLVLAPTFKVLKAPPPPAEGPVLLPAGSVAPDFTAQRFVDGGDPETFRLSDFRGRKIVVVDMWATWCSPCMASLPHLSKIHDAVKDQDVEVIALNVNDDEKPYLRLINERRAELHMTFARDPAGRQAEGSFPRRDYNVRGIPATFVIDKDGKVAASISGYEAGDTRVEAALKKLGVKID
ncbi:MAG: TlpA disulfide reductase family protein [Planctomycetota bacterium]